MTNIIQGVKKEMTTVFDRFGRKLPATQISAEPNVAIIVNGLLQLGFKKRKKAKKPQNYYVKNLGFAPRHIKEIKKNQEDLKNGDKVTVAIFETGDEVKVTGVTKGRGFAGGVKRHGFHGGPKTHGQSDRHRAPGSIGQTTTPGRVLKGKRMAGHMGVMKNTVRNLEVLEVNLETNTLVVKGAIPGAKNGLILVEKTGKVRSYSPPPPPPQQEETDVKEANAKDEKSQQKPKASEKPKEAIDAAN